MEPLAFAENGWANGTEKPRKNLFIIGGDLYWGEPITKGSVMRGFYEVR